MGADFARRAKKTFEKSWDHAKVRLGTADLFTKQPDCVGHSTVFEILDHASLHAGDTVVVEKEGPALVARNRLTEVARAVNPPTDVLRAVEESCGVAKGTINQVHTGAGVAEISLC